jgi:cytochrome c biogenesis protein CcmG/thiol:disulfide interchange protein DsbE
VASPRTKLFAIIGAVLGVVAALWLVAARQTPDDPGAVVELSGPMPELAGPAVTDGTVGQDLYRDEVVVVNFWASWCGPCRLEQPGLQRLWEEYGDRGVEFVGVNFRDDPAAAREYLREFAVTYLSVVDADGRIAHAFGVPYLPATVLVDASGELRYRLLGAQTETNLRHYVEQLLDAAESA